VDHVDTTVLAHARALADPVLADPGQVGKGIGLLIGPVVIALALITWLTLVIRASSRKIKPERPDQSPHRGPMEGGLYRYSPGMYSHSYAPGEAEYVDAPADQEGGPERQPAGVAVLEHREPRQKRRFRWPRRR
jgi:hypothetical protein